MKLQPLYAIPEGWQLVPKEHAQSPDFGRGFISRAPSMRRDRVGDGVTPVALSHHRTCGSAYGGS